MSKITVYGADWCHDTHRTRRQLDELAIPYNYVDIDDDPDAEQWITDQHNGKRVTPTVDLEGTLLFEPSNEEMEQALRESGMVT
jgi:glutaredoxin